MRVQTYWHENRARHGGHPWSIDLVAATASCVLLVGFACALVAVCVH
jgi:hypothetical protein